MKKILLVSEHPLSTSGNGGMVKGTISQLNRDLYDVTVFACEFGDTYNEHMALEPVNYNIISAKEDNDYLGRNKLLKLLSTANFDVVLFVGHDIWQYQMIFDSLNQTRTGEKKFTTGAIFPWDIQKIRMDWVAWINKLDFPCVYSQHGFDVLSPYCKNIRYFKPIPRDLDLWKKIPDEERNRCRKIFFPGLQDDELIFGFVGKNQFRKDCQRLLKGFKIAHEQNPKISLYLHTDMVVRDKYNLVQYAKDCGYKNGPIRAKKGGATFSMDNMLKLFNSFDCLINCSLQEGLSWTPLEAMLCGVPVIASDTTAQTEIVKDAGLLVPQTIETYQPLFGELGPTYIDALACAPEDIAKAILEVAGDKELRNEMSLKGLEKAKNWVAGISDINGLLEDMTSFKQKIEVKSKQDKILFVQHSAGGDVLMTTQCFKGLKERHKNKPLVYMTQSTYSGIVEGNPYIDEIIPWNTTEVFNYEYVYNPHGEKILPGGWNNLDIKLYSMYPYFCKVEADDMYINEVKPEVSLPEKYIVLNTGGGSEYRRYAHFDLATKGLQLPIVQIGSANDPACVNVSVDLRERLTWRESAYIMRRAVASVTIDSFCAHLSGAVGTDSVVLFGPAPARVTGPKMQHGSKCIELQPNMLDVCPILSHCWGNAPNGKVKCTTPCINTINPMIVRQCLDRLIKDNLLKGEKK